MVVVKRICWIAINVAATVLIWNLFIGNKPVSGWIGWVTYGFFGVIISAVVSLLSSLILYKDDLVGMLDIIKRMLRR